MSDVIQRYKEQVDKLFESISKSDAAREKTEQGQEKKKRLRDPEPTPLQTDKDIEGFAKEKALQELDKIREAFLDFQEETKDLVMFNYMFPYIEAIAQWGIDLADVFEDNFDESKLDPDTLKKYKSIKNLRAQILSKIYNRYKKNK
jgi:hypothetical protein